MAAGMAMKIYIGKMDATAQIGGVTLTTDDDANSETLTFDSLVLYTIGSQVKIVDGGKVQYIGTIIQVDQNIRPPHSYRAVDFAWNLKDQEIIQFKKIRADSAIKKLCKLASVQCSVCSMPTKITKIYKADIMSIIKDIMKKAKAGTGWTYYAEVRGSKLIIEKKKQYKIHPTFIMADEDAIMFSIEDLRNSVKVVKGNKTLATTNSTSSMKKLGTRRKVTTVTKKITKAKALAQAKKELKSLNKTKAEKNISIIVTRGYWDIRKNRLIYINGGGLKGWYVIRAATHTIEGGSHRFDLSLSWSAAFK